MTVTLATLTAGEIRQSIAAAVHDINHLLEPTHSVFSNKRYVPLGNESDKTKKSH